MSVDTSTWGPLQFQNSPINASFLDGMLNACANGAASYLGSAAPVDNVATFPARPMYGPESIVSGTPDGVVFGFTITSAFTGTGPYTVNVPLTPAIIPSQPLVSSSIGFTLCSAPGTPITDPSKIPVNIIILAGCVSPSPGSSTETNELVILAPNITGAGAPVSSVFGRTGAVVAQDGDYTPVQIGTSAQGARLEALANVTAAGALVQFEQGTAESAIGPAGTVLTSNGSGEIPTFKALPGSLPPSGAASGDLGGDYPDPTVVGTHLAAPLPVAQGGTSAATLPANAVLIGNGTGAPTGVTMTDGQLLVGVTGSSPIAQTVTGDVDWNGANAQVVSTHLTDPLPATQGGLGAASLTAHGVVVAEGAGAATVATTGTAGRILLDQGAGADPLFAAMSGDATITAPGVITVSKTGGTPLGTMATQNASNVSISGGQIAALLTNAYTIGAVDTRFVPMIPYGNTPLSGMHLDFKSLTEAVAPHINPVATPPGVTQPSPAPTGGYGVAVAIGPWTDASGGPPVVLGLFSNGLFVRVAFDYGRVITSPMKNPWTASSAYAVGDFVFPSTTDFFVFVCTVAGTSGTAEPTWPASSGDTVTDGTATWAAQPLWGPWTLISAFTAPPTVG